MTLALLSIPLLGSFIGIGTFYSFYLYSKHSLLNTSTIKIVSQNLLENLNVEEILEEEIDKVDWEASISPLLHKRLEQLIEVFKQHIPMISMIITPQLSVKLTDLAVPELLKLIPDLQDMLIENIDSDALKDRVAEKISHVDTKLLNKLLYPLFIKGCIYAAILGFIIGCIQLGIALYLL